MSRRPRSPRHAWPILLAIIAALSSWNAVACLSEIVNDRETRLEMEEILRTLWNGTPDQRLGAARRSHLIAELVRHEPPDADLMTTEEVVASLQRLVALSSDDYLLSRVLGALTRSSLQGSPLTPVFLDALRYHSPNVRVHGVRFFRYAGDDDAKALLEEIWPVDRERWFRSDLMSALVRQGSTRYLDDFVELARSEDVKTVISAIQPLGEEGGDEATAALAALARSSSGLVAYEALWALYPKSDSEQALSAILGLTASNSAALRTSATMLLKDFHQEAATLRLAEIARSNDDVEVRFAALCSLEGRMHPAVAPVMASGRHEIPCFYPRQWPNHMERFRVDPRSGADVAACRPIPAGEVSIDVSAGFATYVYDRFEREGQIWIQTATADGGPCWVSEDDVAFIEPELPEPRDWKPWSRLRERPGQSVSAQ